MTSINIGLMKSSKYQKILNDIVPDLFTPVEGLPSEIWSIFDECKGASIIGNDDLLLHVYVMLINTTFFLESEEGYIGVLHHSEGNDLIVSFKDEIVLRVQGDNESNWTKEFFSDLYEDEVSEFIEKCAKEFGIPKEDRNFNDGLDLTFPGWSPIITP